MNHKIGLEVSSSLATRISGIQRYIIELSTAIAVQHPELNIQLCYKGTRYKKAGLRPKSSLKHRWYWPVPGLSLGRFDLVHALDTTLPWPKPRKLICTIHDLFSITLKEYSRPRFRKRKIRAYQAITRKCDAIIVPSRSTKNDLLDHFDYPSESVFIVPHGVDQSFFQTEASLSEGQANPDNYILAFGGRERKNLLRVVKAYARSGLAKDLKLKVVGSLEQEVEDFVQINGLEANIIILGRVSDQTLPQLYKQAAMLCFPSLYEGFGLPVLEGMAAGIPVITSRTGATADISQNHAILVDPMSVPEISTGMKKALTLERGMLDQARIYAMTQTWETAARKTLEIYNSVLIN